MIGDIEVAILGAFFMDPGAYDRAVSSGLTTEMFRSRGKRAIYLAVANVASDGKKIDIHTVAADLERRGKLTSVGGKVSLANMVDELPDPGAISEYVQILREENERDALREWVQSLEMRLDSGEQEVGELVSSAEMDLRKIAGKIHSNGAGTSAREFISRLVEQIEDGDYGAGSVPTGFEDLDILLGGGMSPGCLYIVAGRPGMGKTSLAMNISHNVAVAQGKPCGVFSLEMSADELGLRALSLESNIPIHDIRSGKLATEEWKELLTAQRKVGEAPLYIEDSGANRIDQLVALARRMRAENQVELLILDYLQLCVAGRQFSNNRTLEMSTISRSLKLLARQLEIPVIAVSQLSREVEKRPSKRPQLSDLRDSGAIEQDADGVIFLYRDAYYNPQQAASNAYDLTDVTLAKHRHGKSGKVVLEWEGAYTRFSDHVVLFGSR